MTSGNHTQADQTQPRVLTEIEKEEVMKKLPKRLAYILRYGALKEGLEVNEQGYVYLNDLMKVNLLRDYTSEEVLNHINTSVSYRNVKRFEHREKDGRCCVRAAYLRKFEKNPHHFGTLIPTLFECCLRQILNNLDDYDLQNFPDEHILGIMIHRRKQQKKLSTKTLQVLLVPAITCLDLERVYLTNNTLRLVWTQCPDLKIVSLKRCGYIMTDSVLTQFTKNLPKLEQLNLSSCTHLTTKCLSILLKNLLHLRVLHISRVHSIKYDSILNFMKSVKELTFLDVYDLRTQKKEHDILMNIAKERGITLVLKEPRNVKDNRAEDSEVKNNAICNTRSNNLSHDVQPQYGQTAELNAVADVDSHNWRFLDDEQEVDSWYEGHDYVYMEDKT